MHAGGSRPVCSRDRSGELAVRVGVPLAGVYLEFLGGRCRPNTVRAAAYDLKVFFSVVAKRPDQVQPADVLAFVTAQRTGRVSERGAPLPEQAMNNNPTLTRITGIMRMSGCSWAKE